MDFMEIEEVNRPGPVQKFPTAPSPDPIEGWSAQLTSLAKGLEAHSQLPGHQPVCLYETLVTRIYSQPYALH